MSASAALRRRASAITPPALVVTPRRVFGAALDGEFRGSFAEVAFAIVDETDDQRTISPFQRRFAVR